MRATLVAVCLASFASVAFADSVALRGRVILLGDAASPLPGAEVAIRAADGAVTTVTADEQGAFVAALAPGRYVVSASLPGVGDASQDVALVDGAPVDLVLDLRPAGEVIAVRGLNAADRLRQSAEAVSVITTEAAQRATADLGEVLARSTGVGVRRGGGLGSRSRFTLNGLGDDQIRFFLDGVPLELAGYPFGLENVPINLIERIDVYRGVVPVRFGADALGGAINLVAERESPGAHGSASYQTGSFGTQQLTLGASYDGLPSGLFVRGAAFVDHADNDYLIDADVPDAVGRVTRARVRRFHDGYDAYGANAEVGVAGARWADRASIRAFATGSQKEIQHNLVMTVPYGAAETRGRSIGGAAVHRLAYGHGASSDIAVGYALTRGWLDDDARCVYDWFGQCVRDRQMVGELALGATSATWWSHDVYARAGAEWQLNPHHRVRVSLSPTATMRDSRDQRQPGDAWDHGDDERLISLVTGAEYTYAGLDDRLEVTAFAKHYTRGLRIDYDAPNAPTRSDWSSYPGFGAGARYRLADDVFAKASYEWAVRLPSSYEVLGDGALTLASYDLKPERSHNANLGLSAARTTPIGAFEVDVNAFLRDAEDLILLVGSDRVFQHFNVYGARSLGTEAAAAWTGLCEHLSLLGNVTWMSLRNNSPEGQFGEFDGDRIPNTPWLFANLGARAQVRGVAAPNDELALTWTTRYVHDFFRGWESIGDPRFKHSIDAQLVHGIGLSYLVTGDRTKLSFAIEAQNVTDAAAFDFYGQQRPGRAMYVKTTAQF